jgi:hypothetical protein
MIQSLTFIDLGTVVIGGFNLIYAGRLLWQSWRARRWPTFEGQLLSADLERRKYVPAPATWRLRVLYQYTVGTHTYKNGKISPEWGPAFFSEELGRLAILQKWRPGTAVRVHVNPRSPQDAMLSSRVSLPIYLLVVAGAALTAGGIWDLLSR